MKVYILAFDDIYNDYHVDGLFSSYSAMLTYLKCNYSYQSEVENFGEEDCGAFTKPLVVDNALYTVYYFIKDVIGEHSALTGTISV
mgnify:FL=1